MNRSTDLPAVTSRSAAGVVTAFALFLFCLVTGVVPAGTASAASEGFAEIDPTRLLDTRNGVGVRPGPIGPGETVTLDVAGVEGIADDATAVIINVTSTQATEPGFVTIWPSGDERPLAASLNLDPGQDTPNLVIVGLGEDGAIDLYNSSGTTHLVGDVTGYFMGDSEFTPTAPRRFLDTRDGTGGFEGKVVGDSIVRLRIGGIDSVPPTADAVVVNVTSVQATEPAFVTVYPTGEPRPLAATLNTEPGQATPNLAIAQLGAEGSIDLFVSNGATHLTVDVMGYFDGAETFVGATPYRLLDTREGVGADQRPVGAEESFTLQVAGVGPIPADATAVVINLTSIQSTEPSYLTAWPSGEERPLAASLNTEPGQATPNLAVLKLGDDGAIQIYNRFGTTHLAGDVAGWFVPAPIAPPPAPRVLDLTDRSEATLSGTGYVEDSGITSGGNYTWNTTTRVLEVDAGASAFATGEDFRASSSIRADFSPYTANATFEIDVDWWGTMTSFVGASASAEMYLAVRLIPRTGPSANSVIWEHVFVDDGIGSGLKALEVLKIEDRSNRTFTMPTLDPNEQYRMEVEVQCRARVVFSIGATVCDVSGGDRDVRVRDWSLTFTD